MSVQQGQINEEEGTVSTMQNELEQ